MPKKRRRQSPRGATMQRNVVITSIAPRISFSVKSEEDGEPEFDGHQGLELRGQLIEPIGDVQDVVINLWPDPEKRVGPVRPVAVAHIVSTRPEVKIIGNCYPADFQYLWTMALAGHLKHSYLSFTKPHYGSASVSYMSFSKEAEE